MGPIFRKLRQENYREFQTSLGLKKKRHCVSKSLRFMDKKLSLKLNGGRHVQGILRGFDPFMNLVIDECVEMATSGQQNNIGMVVIRGNSIIMLEALERV
ncbi:mCG130514, isoform CRA_b [Mus musculus]|nr:mCG130514, isoform CRA_b [Mus musculus]